MSFCTKCGNELSKPNSFCPQCGEKLETELEIESITQKHQTQNPPNIKKPKRIYATAVVFFLFGILYFLIGVFTIKDKLEAAVIFLLCSIPFLYSSYHLFKNNPVKLKYWSGAFVVFAIGSFAAQYFNSDTESSGATLLFLLLSLLSGLSDKPYKKYLASLNKPEET
jgi:hypothetical protein